MDDLKNRPSGSAQDEEQLAGGRRRGDILENAILQAAWDELKEVGYAHLTMEGVAARARTNKTALYRRWPAKSELVVAVLHKHVAKPAEEIPDTGNLRSDVLILLRTITQPLQMIGAETLHGLLAEHLGKDFISSVQKEKHSGMDGRWGTYIMTILKNAELRGEVSLKSISPRAVLLPVTLLQYEILTTFEPVSDETVAEIVDDIFLPLVHALPINKLT